MSVHALITRCHGHREADPVFDGAEDSALVRCQFIGPVLAPIGVAAAGAGGGAGVLGGFGSAIGGLAGLGIGSSAPTGPLISGGNPLFNDRNYINIAPVGVNLGEMLRNFEGPPENGGFGLETQSRMSPTIGASFDLLGSKIGFSTGILPILLVLGGAVIIGAILVR